ncbi:uncharacterized protein LOC109821063 [Asparagus officinalis]|uniref:uncharacterized protein LOC109821063 n=1 Tax=Asparagus officinalis TaxID=4686 RepID=UPI00098E1915|nr:uncharacterized protein LOC109821063 [Asparagus officinalis]
MEECKPNATPMNQKEKLCKEYGAAKIDESLYKTLIGWLMYLTTTRPEIMNAVGLLSSYMHCASEIHFQAAKRIVRYIKGTIDYGLRFYQVKNFTLHGYFDSDWAGCVDDMGSTLGYCFSFGSAIFSWCSKKQEIIAQSTAEAEAEKNYTCIWASKQILQLLENNHYFQMGYRIVFGLDRELKLILQQKNLRWWNSKQFLGQIGV